MQYIPSTPEIEKEMLATIGVKSFEELLKIVPDDLRLKKSMQLQDPISELELVNKATEVSNHNVPSGSGLCFLGAGVYDHFVPTVVDFLSSRSEFYTAYTPYQAEVSQGTLQAMYEFQTMICELSGMDVANASLYEGGSALAEACSLAVHSTRKKKIYTSSTVNPRYCDVAKTYFQNHDIEFVSIPTVNGITDITKLNEDLTDCAAVVIQSPNYFGLIEDWTAWRGVIGTKSKTLLIAVGDPMSLSIMNPPGSCGAEVYVGEGQVLGNYMSYGGPYLGLMAVKSKYMRKMPGRIIGKTVDAAGKDGYVLTLQTREQHIRRENATSNICTNQGLMALRAAIYMTLMGKENLSKLTELCFQKAQFAAEKINNLEGYSLPYGQSFIKEFVIKTDKSAQSIIKKAEESGIFIGGIKNDQTDRLLLIAVTEKRTKSQIDKLVSFLSEV